MAVPRYEITSVPNVKQQLRRHAQHAVLQGKDATVARALRHIMRQLEIDPARFGEPAYRTRKPGGLVYKAVHQPFSVSYVVYEPERVVLLIDVSPMPRSYME
jgi:hypothetical protein